MESRWTPIHTAEQLGLSPRYIRRLVRENTLVAERYCRRIFINPTIPKNADYIKERKKRIEAEKATAEN